jgi:transposase
LVLGGDGWKSWVNLHVGLDFGRTVLRHIFGAAAIEAMKIASYETDLTDAQWVLIKRFLPAACKRGRPRTDLREVMSAILYLVKAGCAWRLLPQSFPPWKTVYHHFRQWSRSGLLATLNTRLRALARKAAGKRSRPTAAVLDSQSVRSNPHGGAVGYDAGKKTKGRKRFLLVDTLGWVLGAAVAPAHTPERAGAQALLATLLPHFTWLRKLWVDGGYSGEDFAAWVKTQRALLDVEVIKRSDDTRGFTVLPKRWVVERTFGWLMQHRRLVRDYEKTETSATGWIFVAMLRVMLRRIA